MLAPFVAPWVAGSVVAVATVGAGLAGSEVGTLTDPVFPVFFNTIYKVRTTIVDILQARIVSGRSRAISSLDPMCVLCGVHVPRGLITW